MKKVIYTCLVGNYDSLEQPLAISEEYEYICFSNDIVEETVGIWQIRKIPYSISEERRLSRYVKMLPHEVLHDYDYSLYIDANLQILDKKLYDVLDKKIDDDEIICQVPHLTRNCIYDEIRAAYFGNNVSLGDARRQMNHLHSEHFPSHFGLCENNVIFRKHNDERIIKISEEWWNEYCQYSARDQFSLMYVYWKNGIMPSLLLGSVVNARNSELIGYKSHLHSKSPGESINRKLRPFVRMVRTLYKSAVIKLFLK